MMKNLDRPQIERNNLYVQVSDILARRISDQEYPHGSYLPNEYELSVGFGVSIGTVRKAIDRLVEANLVERRQGRGTLVNDRRMESARARMPRFREQATSTDVEWRYETLSYTLVETPSDIQSALFLEPGGRVHAIKRMRRGANGSIVLDEIYLPEDRFPQLNASMIEGYRLLSVAKAYQLDMGRVEEFICAAPANVDLRQQLETAPETLVLHITRIAHDTAGIPIEYRVMWCNLKGACYWSERR